MTRLLRTSVAGAILAALTSCAEPTGQDCSTAPVTGFAFQQCTASRVSGDTRGALYRHDLRFADAQSEVWAIYYRSEGNQAVPTVQPANTPDFFVSPVAYGATLQAGSSNYGRVQTERGERFFDFMRDDKRCKGHMRYGRQLSTGAVTEYGSMLLLVMCRVSPSPISTREARFLTDRLKFE